ncbi:TerC family protein [Buchnera aphidicola]|uniref:TerC family protein n=1 Tax=Buchnera aphidicola TaxID=9 RepID=UPI002237547B|nr:transporter associated domain-containing protein [Buchnera aphidicola]MCW5197721.1 hypothetical protein [Buchnera aphidicola (Chaitophorus viminalis)]
MGILLDPSTWTGLFALVLLEIILGIDNLIFLTIITKKLNPNQRTKARNIGLVLSLLIRIIFLYFISWFTSLTAPLCSNKYIILSVREFILLIGGIFLSIISLIELYDKIYHKRIKRKKHKKYSYFWSIILQIIILDTIFSLDSIITAIGMINNFTIISVSMIISMFCILALSNTLKKFVEKYKKIFILCLGFLLIIGVNLVLEALGLYLSKTYLYTAVGFYVFIELFNEISKYNFLLYQYNRPFRRRILENFLKILKREKNKDIQVIKKFNQDNTKTYPVKEYIDFKEEEKYMISSLLHLSLRSVKSIMTPRTEISWININQSYDIIKKKLLNTPHNIFPVCEGKIDKIIGVVRAKELILKIEKNHNILNFVSKHKPIIISEKINLIKLLKILKNSKGNIILVKNKFNMLQGLVTPVDFLKAIAGDFPDSDKTPNIIKQNNSWIVQGSTDLYSLQQRLNTNTFIKKNTMNISISGFIIEKYGTIPVSGQVIKISSFIFKILKATKYKIDLIKIKKNTH